MPTELSHNLPAADNQQVTMLEKRDTEPSQAEILELLQLEALRQKVKYGPALAAKPLTSAEEAMYAAGQVREWYRKNVS